MMANGGTLDNARELADVTVTELWVRYFGLGGTATRAELGEFLRGENPFGSAQYDVLAHALNERFMELEMNHPVSYAKDAT